MSARKSPPRCNGTGEASTNRKEKRMHIHLTPDSVGEAIARIEDLLEFHGMPRNSWSVPWSALELGYTARVLLPEGWSHPDATGTMFKAIEVDAADLVAALIAVGDKFAEAVNFKAAS